MEEKKNGAADGGQKKLTYEQLAQYASEVGQQNQQLVQRLRQMQAALDEREFNFASFYISMLFKVMEHPEMYDGKFVEWAAKEIQEALTSFKEAANGNGDDKVEKNDKK